MTSLALANVWHRKLRSSLAALAVAIGVAMLVTMLALSHGTLEEVAQRVETIEADLVVLPPKSSLIYSQGAALSNKYESKLSAVTVGGRRLVKRVIAVEGQTIEIRNKQVYVDGSAVPLPETAKFIDPRLLPQSQSTRDNVITVTVPEDRLFVMGDNRDNSIDSRSWGFLDEDLILAKVVLVLYSWEPDPTRPFWNRIRWGRFGHILR